MNLKILKNELDKLNIPQNAYCLTGGLPNESYCIALNNNNWEVYYSERGNKFDLKLFENESSACEYFLSVMKRQNF